MLVDTLNLVTQCFSGLSGEVFMFAVQENGFEREAVRKNRFSMRGLVESRLEIVVER